MNVVFFKNPKKNSRHGVAAINYLLNERVDQGTARVLIGNEKLTRSVITGITFKQKATVGCLSFEEKNIDEKLKYEIMEQFENMLLPGMKGRFNILWVEHTDKERLELNFVIPKIDLLTRKSLNPYYHAADLNRIIAFQELMNLSHDFTSTADPRKRRTVKHEKIEFSKIESYKELDIKIKKLVKEGKLGSKVEIIKALKKNKIDITRNGKEYISIKLPGNKKSRRFKHEIYSDEFEKLEDIKDFLKAYEEEVETYINRDIEKEKIKYKKVLELLVADKKEKLKIKYKIKGELYELFRRKTRRTKRNSRRRNRIHFTSIFRKKQGGNRKVSRRNNLHKMSSRNLAERRKRIKVLLQNDSHLQFRTNTQKPNFQGRTEGNKPSYYMRSTNSSTERISEKYETRTRF